jgi:hypothetical protein
MGVRPEDRRRLPTVIRQRHTILSAVFTTAFNDQITRLHPCRGVKTPPVAKKLRTIITPDQFDQLYTGPAGPQRRRRKRLGCSTTPISYRQHRGKDDRPHRPGPIGRSACQS